MHPFKCERRNSCVTNQTDLTRGLRVVEMDNMLSKKSDLTLPKNKSEEKEIIERVYNMPSYEQVAAVWVDDNPSASIKTHDILIYGHSNTAHRVNYYYGCYDPLQYPLIFTYGEPGWYEGIKKVNLNTSIVHEDFIQINQIDSAEQLIEMEDCAMKRGRLLQQYIVDMYVKIETVRLDYFRSDLYPFYRRRDDGVTVKVRGSVLDNRWVVPYNPCILAKYDCHINIEICSSVNAVKYLYKYVYKRHNRVNFMVNKETNEHYVDKISNYQTARWISAPKAIWRIFSFDLFDISPSVVSLQLHIEDAQLVTYNETDDLSEVINKYSIQRTMLTEFFRMNISNEKARTLLYKDFPTYFVWNTYFRVWSPRKKQNVIGRIVAANPSEDPKRNPHLHATVIKHMMYGPCEQLNSTNVFIKNNHTYKNKRRDDGVTVKVRGSVLDNRWVVPYNPCILAKYDCHINVEICSSVKAVKCLYKYVYKGHDRVNFTVNKETNEHYVDKISNYQTARWISAPKAIWRIFSFDLFDISPSVVSLQLHIEDAQLVTYNETDDLSEVINKYSIQRTMLTEFFRMNISNEKARTLLYKDFPTYFVWNTYFRVWSPRKKQNVIGRIVAANPSEGERYFLIVLLNYVKEPKSFQDLRTVNNIVVPTYREAAFLHGLIGGNNYCEIFLNEAITYEMPISLRRLFANVLIFCSPTNPVLLNYVKEPKSFQDLRTVNNIVVPTYREAAFLHGLIGGNNYCEIFLNEAITYEMPISLRRLFANALRCINSFLEVFGTNINDFGLVDFDVIVNDADVLANMILEETANINVYFFIDEPGGTEKTCLYKALLVIVRSRQLVALATASSGVAVSLLPVGRTGHSRFKIQLQASSDMRCSVSKQSSLGQLLRMTKLIVWDEAPMINGFVVFGGDFRSVLPVVQRETKDDIMKASLVFSDLWQYFIQLPLTENMRAKLNPLFCEYLLRIGNGIEREHIYHMIKFSSDVIIDFESEFESLKKLIAIVFPNFRTYERFIHEDFLNNLTPNGIPSHELVLKRNYPVMLFRSINPSEGILTTKRYQLLPRYEHGINIYLHVLQGRPNIGGQPSFMSRLNSFNSSSIF
ncbi:uncharacterized protein LOC111406602 [Olea europaea var. sylvestris]|uniref:uncharacterized protein LOC111406602 n=1 Tax=Olea europaea var. sylvestris TaxID=158386 RepID=UPI000C1D1475|nr:uncharacterized protein LOC111406602 [Olea europaea var. sylvestris]